MSTDPYAHLAGVYDELVVDPCFASWADFLDDLWSGDEDGVRTVLDVCCGTGLMTDELRRRGYAPVGIDASPAMLALARERLGADVALVETTLPALPSVRDVPALGRPFDAAVSTFDGLNYLDADGLRRTIRVLAPLLRPGGWLVFDLHADALVRHVRDSPVVLGAHASGRWSVTYVVDEEARTCRSIMRLEVDGRPEDGFVEEHHQHLHDDATVRGALEDAGLRLVAVVDEYTPEPVGPATFRATWVARTPDHGGTAP